MDAADGKEGRFGVPGWLWVLGLCVAAIVYCWIDDDRVTSAALAVLTLSGFSGYRMGGAKLCGFFGGLALAFAFASQLGSQLEPTFTAWLGTEGVMNRWLSMGAAGLGITFIVTFTVQLLAYLILQDRPMLQACNDVCGFTLGATQGGVVVLLMLSGIIVVEPVARRRLEADTAVADSQFRRVVAQGVVDLAEHTRQSTLGPLVDAYDPFQHVPQLNRLQRQLQLLSDPQRLKQLVDSDQLAGLKQDPLILQAIDQLREDPQVRSYIESRAPLDQSSILSLMNNPAILKMLEQPELLDQLSEMFGEMDVDFEPQAGSLQ